jgi:hypothetical protein
MVLNPRESKSFSKDLKFADDRRQCARDYGLQVEAPVDLFVTENNVETLVFATDAAPADAPPPEEVTAVIGKPTKKGNVP